MAVYDWLCNYLCVHVFSSSVIMFIFAIVSFSSVYIRHLPACQCLSSSHYLFHLSSSVKYFFSVLLLVSLFVYIFYNRLMTVIQYPLAANSCKLYKADTDEIQN